MKFEIQLTKFDRRLTLGNGVVDCGSYARQRTSIFIGFEGMFVSYN
jgi:hypothetical protein